MATVTVFAIAAVFCAGAITGFFLLVSIAIRREDRRASLSRKAAGLTTSAGRRLTSLYISRPGDGPPRRYPLPRQPELMGDDRGDRG
jgi:hypothetical protein